MMTQNRLSESDRRYIQNQIEKLNSGKFDRDDCLYRIASAADLVKPGARIDDSNRDRIVAWVEKFEGAEAILSPISEFTTAPQAAKLSARFSDKNLEKLSQVDQAALIVILAGQVYIDLAGHSLDLFAIADAFVPTELDFTSEDIGEAIEILDGISADDALGLLQFLVQ